MAVYALSDIHGHLSIYNQIVAKLRMGDRVYYLGDAGDRGPHGWECIKAIYNNPQFKYIKGNHEDMTAKAILGDWDARELSCYNGGYETLEGWEMDGAYEEWGHRLKALPYLTSYTNSSGQIIMLSHAGYTYGNDPDEHDCIWGREHIFDDPIETNVIMVHGHTPVNSIRSIPAKDWNKPYWYANNTKCNIDMGTYRSGKACLLNLDTWDYKIFDVKEQS